MDFIKQNWRYILLFILGFFLGCLVTYYLFPRVITKEVPVDKAVIKTQIEYRDRTQVQYVPKEIIVNPVTGAVTQEKTDVQIDKSQPQINVKFNGKDYAFDLQQGETQKFDKGKLVVDQSSQLKVDVSAQVQQQITDGINEAFKKQRLKNEVDIGNSNHGIELRYKREIVPNVGVYVDSTIDRSHYGYGVSVKF